jgi:lysozyme family protein
MSSLRNKIIDEIIDREGGYVNDPSDSGGETNWGITIATARAYGYKAPMERMTRVQAFEIYTKRYWDKMNGDRLQALSEAVCEEVIDSGVNMGTHRAVRFLQRSLNVLNNRGRHYADLTVDGNAGALTMSALAHFLTTRNEEVLVRMLNCLQGAFYVELAERREKDEKFVYGWFINRVKM